MEQLLAPALRPGDVVIMDKLSAYKVDGARQAIEARGAEATGPTGCGLTANSTTPDSIRGTIDGQVRVVLDI